MVEAPENAAPTSAPAPPAPAPAPAPVTSSPPPKSRIPPRYDLDAKWDACLGLSILRVAYSSLAGAFTGLLLFQHSGGDSLMLRRIAKKQVIIFQEHFGHDFISSPHSETLSVASINAGTDIVEQKRELSLHLCSASEELLAWSSSDGSKN